MNARCKKLAWFAVALLVGCGGYDAEYDCEQTLACEDQDTDANIDLCTDVAEAIYDNANDEQKDLLDELYDACKDEKSCEYVECVEAEL